ncbi:hypothetical protein [Microbacterium sp. XT11]|uniref:hypothetical protein n=1 Tax=Microbacterium sp. XT11 TaxID=367477 RepID=UPI0008345BCC|nr:hypothetical protein [Microbacterium sp. XT11]
MDSPLLFAGIIIAVIVLALVLPRWTRGSSQRAAASTGRAISSSRTDEALAALGSSLLLHAPDTVAREIVDRVALQHPRMLTARGDGGYGIRFVEPDDAVARLVSTAQGTRLEVARTRELLGTPQNPEFWEQIKTHVASGAATQGVASSPGPQLHYARRDGDPPVWVLATAETETDADRGGGS